MMPAPTSTSSSSAARPLRILVVASDVKIPDQHGGSTHVQELVAGLRAHGEVMLLASEGSSGPGVRGVGRPARRWPPLLRHVDAWTALPAALREARAFGPDVIYERCTSYGLGAMLSGRLGVPMLAMVLDQRYSWLSLWRARHLVATRLDLIPRSVRHKGVKVGWGANPRRFNAELSGAPARAQLGLGDAFVVGYSGTFRDWHGLDELVEVATYLLDTPVRFLLVGDGPERGRIERLAGERGVADRFIITGRVPYDDVPELLAASDACVAPFMPDRHGPSRRHGFILDPLKVFEYLALGKPTVTIDAGNIAALFRDPEHLRMVPAGDAEAMAGALRRLMDDPDTARHMAARGRAHVLASYTWDAHAAQLARLFHGMIGPRDG